MLKIYHNPRCAKSREGLEILEKSGKDFEIVKYLDDVPTKEELKSLIGYLGIAPIDLVRTNEAIWKENYKEKKLSDDQIVRAMVEHPKLIERPIVVKGNKAVIGRPPETIKTLL
ncbi:MULTISPECIES: arsenate reductase (glutaredoxin) [Flagellimonas]|uniref:Arsenate reductase (Glutaredoxin) n=1 Tax=Flagellimonas hadalis TaxID=2597517 RepID=A0A5N5IW22_9FLAO|nr:arsenate reductase (glutaredoxin) [Allomuricauda hadalis]KAB5491609.1 arsenate reductase (glutaredoxin) [Allomuricauda hadalis]RUA12776.1 MAG: arsenate reductase (glutaredoxin) [Flavobacteriia bacterium]